MSRILVIEDDEKVGGQISASLRTAGFEVTWWREGRFVTPDEAKGFELLVLDLMLPGEYGLDILKALRSHSELPVLVLSARVDSHDKVRALKLGADDYVTKPFWPEELVERVKARLRRPTMQREGKLELDSLSIDTAGRQVLANGERVDLTPVEFELLVALARRPGQAIQRTWLVEQLLDPSGEARERTLDVHVSRLRKKLGSAAKIEAVWGIGYRLAVSK